MYLLGPTKLASYNSSLLTYRELVPYVQSLHNELNYTRNPSFSVQKMISWPHSQNVNDNIHVFNMYYYITGFHCISLDIIAEMATLSSPKNEDSEGFTEKHNFDRFSPLTSKSANNF